MKDKILAITFCLLLLFSGMLIAVEGVERSNEENELGENDNINEKIEGSYTEKNRSKIIDEKYPISETRREFYRSNQHDLGDRFIDERGKPRDEKIRLGKKPVETRSWEETNDFFLDSPRLESDYEEIDPIRIDSNDDFAYMTEQNNWSGNGTDEDPYIIEDYEIDGYDYGYSLYIGNVTDHFEVKRCHLHNASGGTGEYLTNSGLHLFNTSNAIIEKNLMTNNSQRGIYIDHSDNSTISNNTIYSNEGHQIQLEGSYDNEIINNEIHRDISSSDQSRSQADVDYSKDSVLIKLESPDEDEIRYWGQERALKFQTDEIANTVDGITSRIYPAFNMAEISFSEEINVQRTVESLSRRKEVVHAEPNYIMETAAIPNDPGYDSLWAMPMIDAPEAWDLTTGSEEVVVAVIDSGIDYNHPDLKDNMWTSDEGHHGYNAVNDSYYPMDDNGHGTHVAGTIGAVGDNNLGVVGVNWNVSLMAVKFLGEYGGGSIGDAIAGLEYVLERKREGENIVATSNSWGGTGYSELLYEAIEKHQKEGISFIAAAGNDRSDSDKNPFYPANYDLTNIISVAATDENDDLAWFSNYGKRSVHLGAPGVNINSTVLDGEYGHMSGTSMAAPHVTGVVALLKSHNASYNHNQLKNAILSSVDQLESLKNITLTEGRINAHNALEQSPDPDDVRLWVHRPTSVIPWGEETSISISLNDRVNPILGANVSVEFSTGEDTMFLEDDGSRGDLAEDGYYTGEWIPRTLGEVELSITAKFNESQEMKRNITVTVRGDSGIALLDSEDNVLNDNNISNNFYGVSFFTSRSNELAYNLLESNNQAGMRFYESKDNKLINQTISRSEYGLLFEKSNENSILNSSISNTFMGIRTQDSERNKFSNNNLSRNSYGFIIESSRENILTENDIFDNQFYGMILFQSRNNRVDNNTVDNHWFYGIYILGAKENLLTDNRVSNSIYSILHLNSDDNKLRRNGASNNMIGIYLGNSENVTLKENTMVDGGIYIQGLLTEHWDTHSIDTSNTVNDDPIYYLSNERESTVPTDAGQIILANCEKITVEDQEISGGSAGILSGFSSNNILINNTVKESNWEGITLFKSNENILENNIVSENEFPGFFLFESDGNTLSNNTASRNDYGIICFGSNNNTLINNDITSNRVESITLFESDENILENNQVNENELGIILLGSSYNEMIGNTVEHNQLGFVLAFSTNNTLANNTLSQNVIGITIEYSNKNTLANNTVEVNELGIGLYESKQNKLTNNIISNNSEVGVYIVDPNSYDNLLYRNKFIENENQAWDYGDNNWDAGDPAEDGKGGNYWSDYEGEDRGDGIGEEPYEIFGDDNQDNYPWMTEEMVRWYELTINFEGEGTVNVDGEKFDAEEEYLYKEGSEVELEAIAEEGWRFVEWTGDYQSEERVIIVTMDETKNITALFEEKEKSIQETVIDFVKNILNTVVDFILDIIPDLPDKPDRPDMPEIPGFSFFLLLLGLVVSAAIHHTKKR